MDATGLEPSRAVTGSPSPGSPGTSGEVQPVSSPVQGAGNAHAGTPAPGSSAGTHRPWLLCLGPGPEGCEEPDGSVPSQWSVRIRSSCSERHRSAAPSYLAGPVLPRPLQPPAPSGRAAPSRSSQPRSGPPAPSATLCPGGSCLTLAFPKNNRAINCQQSCLSTTIGLRF